MLDKCFHQPISDCFQIVVSIAGCEEEEIEKAWKFSRQVNRAVDVMLSGSISPDDFLEMIEPFVEDVDGYCDEVEANLTELSKATGLILI